MSASALHLISIVIPCYKHASFLAEGVESLVNQTYPHIEILIVNDGSPDDTSEVARGLIRRYPRHRISLFEKPNGGLADARNAGVAAASGDWVLPFDADDIYDSTFVAKAIDAFHADPTRNLFYTDVESFGATTGLWCPEDYSLPILADHNVIPGPSIYRKELWWRTGGYERALPWGAEDYNFWLGCAQLGLRPYRIPGALFKYRQHAEGSMLSNLMKRWRTVEAMVRTINAHLYPDNLMLAYHQIIAGMDPETFEQLEEKDRRFGDLSWTYLWRALKFVRESRFEEGLDQCIRFERRHSRPDWQPLWCKLLCHLNLEHHREAQACIDALRSWPVRLSTIGAALEQFSVESQKVGGRCRCSPV